MNQENEDNKDETQLSPIKNTEKEKIEEFRKTLEEQMIPQQDNSIQDSIKKSPEFKEDQNRLITNNMIFIIPSWGELLGYPNKLGLYMNTQVAKIQTDFVIFYSGVECALKTNYGLLYYLFGLGYYYTKFELLHTSELTSGKYITDSKILTGLILSDFVYDKLASSEDLTLQDDPDVIIAKNVIKVPIDVAYKDQSKQTLIKGAVMRNIFIPHKDIILDFMEKIRTPGNFNLNLKGHQILSSHPDHYNKILASDKMNVYDPEGYLNSTAVIDEITLGVDELLKDSLSLVELKKIDSTIDDLSTLYSTLEFDPVYPYSIIENASKKIMIETTPISQRQNYGEKELTQKKSIFYSAEPKLSQIKTWPNKFPRYRKQDVELIETSQKTKFPQYIGNLTADSKGDRVVSEMAREEPNKEKDFKLRFEQSKRVSEKVLPNPPKEDIEEILLYAKQIMEADFDAPTVGKALGLARDNIKNIHPVEYHTIKWELSKWANLYKKREPSIGLSPKERHELLEGVQKWLNEFERERLEKERKIREEKERLERERLERERLERERKEKERIEEERKKLEKERNERERLNQLKEQQEILRKQREQEKLEFERQQKLEKEKKRIEEERTRQEALEREAQELKKLKKERKKKEKLLKKQRKKEKKLEKKRLKIERKKAKERQKLEKIKSKLESNDK